MIRLRMVAVVGLLELATCSREADIVPLNDAATATGVPKLSAVLYGTGYGPVTVTMPDGEVLSGHYRLAVGGAVASGFGTAAGPGGTAVVSGSSSVVSMQNPFTLQVTGSRGTTMVCQGTAGGVGHGDAVCTTNRKAQYHMMF